MSTMFHDEASRARMIAAYDRFRSRLGPTDERTVATRYGDTHVLCGGRRGRPPLVLLHGALATSAYAMGELGPLADHFSVYAPDIIGQSAKSADARLPLDGPAYGEWAVQVLDALGLERAHVYGVSWGGFVAQKLVQKAPERIDRLVLLVPAGIVSGPGWKSLTELGLPLALYRAFPSEARLRKFVSALVTTPDEDWVSYFGEALRSYKLDLRAPPLAKTGSFDGFSRPALVFGADRDLSFPGAPLIARAKVLMPHAEVELLEGCRHVPPADDVFRARIGARILRFFSAGTGERAAAREPWPALAEATQ